jgi:hypothetical protein
MSSKTIKVNPIFLSSGSSSGTTSIKNKTRKEKPAGLSLGQSNIIKKKLIARIKDFQHHKQNVQHTNASEPLNDAFGESVQFLNNLARDKEDQKREKKNTTLKKKQPPNPEAYMHIATELPPELLLGGDPLRPPLQMAPQMPMPQQMAPQMPMPQQVQMPMQMPMPMPMQVPMQVQVQMPLAQVQPTPISQWQAAPAPSYSNLKNGGTRPTYRTWLRSTQKNRQPATQPAINILEDIGLVSDPLPLVPDPLVSDPLVSASASAPLASVSDPLASVPPFVSEYKPSFRAKRKRITKTLKYKLGKHANGTVSVLIKNSQTRRKVQTEQALLKQKSILDIKNHLRGNNLLKVGSNAPNDVLRHLYEQSILAGQIENKAKETLLHNYFNADKQ